MASISSVLQVYPESERECDALIRIIVSAVTPGIILKYDDYESRLVPKGDIEKVYRSRDYPNFPRIAREALDQIVGHPAYRRCDRIQIG